jgi:hypothetical protein
LQKRKSSLEKQARADRPRRLRASFDDYSCLGSVDRPGARIRRDEAGAVEEKSAMFPRACFPLFAATALSCAGYAPASAADSSVRPRLLMAQYYSPPPPVPPAYNPPAYSPPSYNPPPPQYNPPVFDTPTYTTPSYYPTTNYPTNYYRR